MCVCIFLTLEGWGGGVLFLKNTKLQKVWAAAGGWRRVQGGGNQPPSPAKSTHPPLFLHPCRSTCPLLSLPAATLRQSLISVAPFKSFIQGMLGGRITVSAATLSSLLSKEEPGCLFRSHPCTIALCHANTSWENCHFSSLCILHSHGFGLRGAPFYR